MSTPANRVLYVANTEFRITSRLARFRIALILLTLVSLTSYGISCFYLTNVAAYSASFGIATPKFLLGDIDPTFFLMFQIALLLLAFDVSHRHSHNRVAEVLMSKPVSNFEFLAGRVLCLTSLLWLVAAANICVMYLFGLLSNATNLGVADTFETHSLLSLLLLDMPTTLLFWSSFVVFMSAAVRVRAIVVLIGLALMLIWFFVVVNAPYSLLSIVSPSSNDVALVSELAPEFASRHSILMRISMGFVSVALVIAGSMLMSRQDRSSPVTGTTLSIVAIGLSTLFCVLGVTGVHSHYGTVDKWREFHESYLWNAEIDVVNIAGSVHIDPSRHLKLDLSIDFVLVSGSPEELVFTFNPGMSIERVELDEASADYSFTNGLLEIDRTSLIPSNSMYNLRLVAQGVPDPRFAYFDSAVDYLSSTDVPVRSVKVLGRDGAIFNSNFVALMPGAYWYPVPGTVNGDYLSSRRGIDYFDASLAVELKKQNWQLIGTGVSNQPLEDSSSYHIQPMFPVPALGLFASEFQSAAMEIDGRTYTLHLHKKHSKNLRLLGQLDDEHREEAKRWLTRFTEQELALPHSNLAFVEVPRALRTVGGGWRMESVNRLPEVVLIKETDFPTARLEVAFSSLAKHIEDKSELAVARLRLLQNYAQSTVGADNPWTNLPGRLWLNSTSARGKYSQEIDHIIMSLISMSAPLERPVAFSIYSTFHVADSTAIDLQQAFFGFEDAKNRQSLNFISYGIGAGERNHGSRQALWEEVENRGLSDLPSEFGHRRDLELLLFKCTEIAKGLRTYNDHAKIHEWISDVRERFSGTSYSYEELIAIAEEHDVTVDPFLTDWLDLAGIPGFVISSVKTSRISDDENGDPQYVTSLNVRNTQPIAGVFQLWVPTEPSSGSNWGSYYLSASVIVEGDSAKRLNQLTAYPIDHVAINPFMSLNRNIIQSVPNKTAPANERDLDPPPFEEKSTWRPLEQGIVVDDLSSGFEVFQQYQAGKRSAKVGPLSWFGHSRHMEERDNGLPIFASSWLGPIRNVWHRTWMFGAYGQYRNTIVAVYAKTGLPLVRFSAELNESAKWQLDYHSPFDMNREDYKGLVYELAISTESQTWNANLSAIDLKSGWNSVGEFELPVGEVYVDFVGTSKPGYVFADAIRWTKM